MLENIRILKKTEPGMCGGTDATQDMRAPQKILSEEMNLFDVTSALNTYYDTMDDEKEELRYIQAFAAKDAGGTFLFLETEGSSFGQREQEGVWALVKEDVFPALVKLVNECELAKDNGFHSQTHGLPENFGGSVRIKYDSGEEISFSNNQQPILAVETAVSIKNVFKKALEGERVLLPDISDLKELRFSEIRENGGFTKAVLTLSSDGTGENLKESRYDDPEVYKSIKTVDKETIVRIKNTIKATGLLAWAGLYGREYGSARVKELTFVFADGTEITVQNGRQVPQQLYHGFFDIELEMTTKN